MFNNYSFDKKVARTHNKGLQEIAGKVVNQTFIQLINSCGWLTVRASKSATSLSPEPLVINKIR